MASFYLNFGSSDQTEYKKEPFTGAFINVRTGETATPEQLIKQGFIPDRDTADIARSLGFTGADANQIQEKKAKEDATNIPLEESKAILEKLGLDPNTVTSFLDANGKLPDYLTTKDPAELNTATDVANKLNTTAFSTELTPFALAQLEKQKFEQTGAVDTANQSNMGARNNAFSELAMRGGLESGARERIASEGMKSGFSNLQNIYRAGETARLGINAQDYQTKQNLQTQLPSMFSNLAGQRTNISNSNIDRIVAERNAKRTAEEERRKTGAALFGSFKTNPEN